MTAGMVIVPPGLGEQHWQPQPGNGWIEVLTSPRQAGAPQGLSSGLQYPLRGLLDRSDRPPDASGFSK